MLHAIHEGSQVAGTTVIESSLGVAIRVNLNGKNVIARVSVVVCAVEDSQVALAVPTWIVHVARYYESHAITQWTGIISPSGNGEAGRGAEGSKTTLCGRILQLN